MGRRLGCEAGTLLRSADVFFLMKLKASDTAVPATLAASRPMRSLARVEPTDHRVRAALRAESRRSSSSSDPESIATRHRPPHPIRAVACLRECAEPAPSAEAANARSIELLSSMTSAQPPSTWLRSIPFTTSPSPIAAWLPLHAPPSQLEQAVSTRRAAPPHATRVSSAIRWLPNPSTLRDRRTANDRQQPGADGGAYCHAESLWLDSRGPHRERKTSRNDEAARRRLIVSLTFGWENWSGRRDSNPRPQPWQGCALPLSYTRSLVPETPRKSVSGSPCRRPPARLSKHHSFRRRNPLFRLTTAKLEKDPLAAPAAARRWPAWCPPAGRRGGRTRSPRSPGPVPSAPAG